MKGLQKISITMLLFSILMPLYGMTTLPFNFGGLPKDMQDEILLRYVTSMVGDLSQEVAKISQKEHDDLEKAFLEDIDFDPFDIRQESKRAKIQALNKGLQKINNLALANKE